MQKIDTSEFRLMRDYIEKHCGIALSHDKAYLVETRLTTLMVETGCRSFREFYHKAVSDATNKLRDKIVDAMTTNETLWFRDGGPFRILEEVLLPRYGEEIAAGRRATVKIWSAACSTGQEPYSIAIIIRELLRKKPLLRPEKVEIIATDISPTVLFLAQAGRFDSVAMSRGMTDDIRARWFTQSGPVWVVDDAIKRMVRFRKLNLQESFAGLGSCDIIFCRNVLIYFSDAFKRDILERMARVLNGGYLILGASESLIQHNDIYEMLSHKRAMYYKAKSPKISIAADAAARTKGAIHS
jgi:chemotaxis protein methyltransferase CheR